MLSVEKATSPPTTSTASPRRTIGRRLRANARMAFKITPGSYGGQHCRSGSGSPRGRREGVTREEPPSVATSSPGFQSLKDLMQTVLLKTDFHRALDQTLAVGCQAATPTSVDFLSNAHEISEACGRPTAL